MKNTGKTLNGVPVYEDPEVPPGQLLMIRGNYIEHQPRRSVQLTEVTKISRYDDLIQYVWLPLAIGLLLFVLLWGMN